MPQDVPAKKVLDAVRNAAGTRVKVAVSDIDGVLRGKYLHKDKFLSAADGRLRLLRRRVRLGHERPVLRQHDAHRLAQGLSRRAGAPRPRHLPQRAVGRRRAVLPRRVRHAEERPGSAASDLPAPGAEARAQARGKARLHGDVRDGVRVVQLRRDAADRGPPRATCVPSRSRPGMFGYSLLRAEPEPRVLQRADGRDGAPSACRSRACTPRPDPACTRRRSSSPTRSKPPTARSCSRPAPRRSARASASCRASWRSGTRSIPAARATSTRACPTARRNLFHDAKSRHGMSKLFESYLAGQLAVPAGVRADVLADGQQLQAAGRRLLGAGQADLGRRQPHRELPRDPRHRPSRRASRRAAPAPT